jgi:hypothetical protein
MPKSIQFIRAVAILALACFLQAGVLPSILAAETPPCPYDRAKPTLDSARISFKSLNYKCAEQEILDVLTNPNLTIEEKADAHVLLAAVYFAMLKNDTEKRDRVIAQFKEAFKAYREWKGELDISSTEFIDMMKQAQDQVDREATASPAETTTTTTTAPPPTEAAKPTTETTKPVVAEQPKDTTKTIPITLSTEQKVKVAEGKSKPFYTKWWAIVLGVGLVAGAVALAGGGGDNGGGGGTVLDTLPSFPDNPPGK